MKYRLPEVWPVFLNRLSYGWIIVAVCFLVSFMSLGARTTFVLSFKSMVEEFGGSRGLLSLVLAANQLFFGIMGPLVGVMVNRYESKTVMAIGTGIVVAGLLGTGWAYKFWHLYFFYGILVAAGLSSATIVPTSKLVTGWFPRNAGAALGVASAGSPAGQLVIAPLAMISMLQYGWRWTFALVAMVHAMIVLPLIHFLAREGPGVSKEALRGNLAAVGSGNVGEAAPLLDRNPLAAEGLRRALRTRALWLLTLVWLASGFGSFMTLIHLAPYATDVGFSSIDAANAVGLLGAGSLLGAVVVGTVSNRLGEGTLLTSMYLLRAFSLFFLALVVGRTSGPFLLYLFALLFGFSVSSVIPLTIGLVKNLFGHQHMGPIMGIVILGHQVGAAGGTYLGGLVFDVTLSYYWAFVFAAILTFVASGGSFLIQSGREEPLA